jgi:DNA processing protein
VNAPPDASLRLLAAAGDSSRSWLKALRRAGNPESLLALGRRTLIEYGLSPEQAGRLCRRSAPVPRAWHEWLDGETHRLIVFGSADYPAQLGEIADAPLALWVDGQHPALMHEPQLAIVGSRHPTGNGLQSAAEFATELSRAGITITSGLARGIDAAGHRGALAGPSGTIAVLGCGIDRIYPSSHRVLADSIRRDGLIVSEYGPTVPVRAFRFPQRNRIIAALSLGTFVVEATRRSGSLITASLAADYGREVFAMPGSIHNPLSRGCHKLLRDGAKLVESTLDLLVEIAPQLCAEPSEFTESDARATTRELPAALAKHLDFSPITFDALASATGLTAGELSSMLLHLEIQGKIEALPGGRYCRLAERAG